MDALPLHRPCSACYAGSVNDNCLYIIICIRMMCAVIKGGNVTCEQTNFCGAVFCREGVLAGAVWTGNPVENNKR